MTQLAIRPRVPFPRTYKSFNLARGHGRVYGVPEFLDAEEIYSSGRLTTHPAILSAATKEELEALIDSFDASPYLPELVGCCEGYNLVLHCGRAYGVPQAAGPVDLNLAEECRLAGVIQAETVEEVEERIREALATVPVEFAGWLPIFEFSGNCGRHPQFTHTAEPPPGYRFTCSAPAKKRGSSFCASSLAGYSPDSAGSPAGSGRCSGRFAAFFGGGPRMGLRARWRVLVALVRLFFRLLRSGARLGAVLRFLQSRHYQSQVLLAPYRGLVFLTSIPYTYGQNPWVVEIEDPTTLFYPLVQNGQTSDLQLAESPYFPIVKSLLESDQCRGILTHMKSTAELVSTLFGSETIRAKIHYTPLGVKLPARWQRQEETEHLNLIFINSWCQVPHNFCLRGGLDVLEAFAILLKLYPHLRLTLRTNLPGLGLDSHYHRIIESGWVRVINRFLAPEEMDSLLAESHIFLLPAARVHIVSLLQAMSYGLALVTSDGWGIEEYVTHERNGLIVKGRYGKVSWADEKAGMLREDYEPMSTADPRVVNGLVEAVSRLVEDRGLRQRLGRTARRDIETKYSLKHWNQGLKMALDRAVAPQSGC